MNSRFNTITFSYVVRLLTTLCVFVYALVPSFVFCTCRGVCLANVQPVVQKAYCDGGSHAHSTSVKRCCAKQIQKSCCNDRCAPKKSCMVEFKKINAVTSVDSANVTFVKSLNDIVSLSLSAVLSGANGDVYQRSLGETRVLPIRLHLILRNLRI